MHGRGERIQAADLVARFPHGLGDARADEACLHPSLVRACQKANQLAALTRTASEDRHTFVRPDQPFFVLIRKAPEVLSVAMEIDVVLPCLNEAGALPWVPSRMPNGFRPIVADNGSTDSSAAIAAAHGARVVHVPQRGFGAACHAGLVAATSDIVCVMDADASFDPGDLPLVADPVLAQQAELMLGRRTTQGKGAWPLHARLGNRVLAAELRRRVGVPVRDLGPMRAARREDLLALEPDRSAVRVPAGDGGARGRGRLADRRDGRPVLPAGRQVEGHRHAPRHAQDRHGHAPGAGVHSAPSPGKHHRAGPRPGPAPAQAPFPGAGLVMTADGYTGRHRREGALGALGAPGVPRVPAQPPRPRHPPGARRAACSRRRSWSSPRSPIPAG